MRQSLASFSLVPVFFVLACGSTDAAGPGPEPLDPRKESGATTGAGGQQEVPVDPSSTGSGGAGTTSSTSAATGSGGSSSGSGNGGADASGSGSGGGGSGATNDCCDTSSSPGCADASVEACVCAMDPFCCGAAWDATCTAEADACGANCGGGGGGSSSGGTGGGGGGGDCGPCIAACLLQLALDPCCDVLACVLATCDSACFGVRLPLPDPACGESSSSSGGGNPGPWNDCCSESASPGCVDPVTEACVCAQDGYCCGAAWDATCVAEVESFGCGACL